MPVITNTTGISLALAVWLLHDEYDYFDDINYISATTLMRPLRQIILPSRIPEMQRRADLSDLIAKALGHSLHDSIEKAWKSPQGLARALQMLGEADSVIGRVLVNPLDEELDKRPDAIPVYLEQRMYHVFRGRRIGGKFDMILNGIVQDNKSTSAYTWLYASHDEQYQLQMSLYRWIDAQQARPKITEDYGVINFIFTDWQKAAARSNSRYPQKRVETKNIPLLPVKQTEQWVARKLDAVAEYRNLPQDKIPECTDEELWRSEPKYKYYSDAANTNGRATRVFDTQAEALLYKSQKGNKGAVVFVPGEPRRCLYCEAFSICKQKDKYFQP